MVVSVSMVKPRVPSERSKVRVPASTSQPSGSSFPGERRIERNSSTASSQLSYELSRIVSV